MPIRAARLTDAVAIKVLFDQFNAELGGGAFTPRTAERYRQMFAEPDRPCSFDTLPAVAAVRRRQDHREYYVDMLFPRRGRTVTELKPVLLHVLNRALTAHPDEGNWRVWADFWAARDAQEVQDGGAFQCAEWKAKAFPTATVRREGGRSIIELTLAEAANA